MAESRTVTGSRDDLVVDSSRCLRMRFSESSCQQCVAICPHGAVMVNERLSIDPELCRGCLLCTTVCPSGALEQHGDFYTCLPKLSKVPAPILGCIRTAECAHDTLTCLGGLSEEHLLTLFHLLPGKLTINLSQCGECHNNKMLDHIKQRLDSLAASQLSYSNCRIVLAESEHDIQFQDEPLDRRSFFKSFRNTLFKSADIIISNSHRHVEVHTEYAAKRLPARRKMLNNIRATVSPELERRIQTFFDSVVTIDENCTACQGCVAICPTGALKTLSAVQTPVFERLSCTGCSLCAEFCLDQSLLIT